MTPVSDDLRQEILALQPALAAYAGRLAPDEAEARQLVNITLLRALDGEVAPPPGGIDTRAWLFGMLRGAFHSVARRRANQRERSSVGRLWSADRADAFANNPVEVV